MSLASRPLVAALLAGVVTAFVAAMVLGVVHLYLTGHSRPSLARPWLRWLGMSRADLVLWLSVVVAAILAWRRGCRAIAGPERSRDSA